MGESAARCDALKPPQGSKEPLLQPLQSPLSPAPKAPGKQAAENPPGVASSPALPLSPFPSRHNSHSVAASNSRPFFFFIVFLFLGVAFVLVFVICFFYQEHSLISYTFFFCALFFRYNQFSCPASTCCLGRNRPPPPPSHTTQGSKYTQVGPLSYTERRKKKRIHTHTALARR